MMTQETTKITTTMPTTTLWSRLEQKLSVWRRPCTTNLDDGEELDWNPPYALREAWSHAGEMQQKPDDDVWFGFHLFAPKDTTTQKTNEVIFGDDHGRNLWADDHSQNSVVARPEWHVVASFSEHDYVLIHETTGETRHVVNNCNDESFLCEA